MRDSWIERIQLIAKVKLGAPVRNVPCRNDRIIELLLNAGADIGAQNTEHYSALL